MRHCLQRVPNGLSNGLLFKGIKVVQPCGSRHIRISTIPSGTLDDLPAEALNISNAVSPGAYFSRLFETSTDDDDVSGRCQV